ncbi:Alpha/Beta hydrolase protein [Jimgerdemannia flammicorona]|uniref:Carboxypeptidase n=1 Tax=Jimgerdemannia flammicorona TaxID=994334 RepID=A0A433QDQ6_9FUNG|nr:Alpha/Beta hydrolase protein [Jimgerdemannia flammicorona]
MSNLPNVTGHYPVNYAGNIPSNKSTPDLDLFFWYFKPPKPSDNLIFWFNGGPGCASTNGLFVENGPWVYNNKTGNFETNPYSWHLEGHIVFVDQPFSVGLSLNNGSGVRNEHDVAKNFYGFLQNFYEAFPQLRSKNLTLTGESYAGMYVPYMAQYIQTQNALTNKKEDLIKLRGIGIGNPVIGGSSVYSMLPLMEGFGFWGAKGPRADVRAKYIKDLKSCKLPVPSAADFFRSQNESHFCLSDSNGPTILDLFYNEIDNIKYADFHALTCTTTMIAGVLTPEARKTLHAKPLKSGEWTEWSTIGGANPNVAYLPNFTDNVAPSHVLLDGLIKSGVKVVIYSGNRDMVVDHLLTESVLQAAYWNGGSGFKNLPMNPWSAGEKEPAGAYISERGLTYVLVYGAGHMVPQYQPRKASALLRDFIL